MNAIDALFQRLRQQKRKAFMPFITAGDPDLATTAALLRELAAHGASLIEVGFPYSDPIADGAVVQASYTRALERGLKLRDLFACLRQSIDRPLSTQQDVPRVGMVSFSLVHHRGPEQFIGEARAAGLSGLIVPDLPVEEAEALIALTADHDVKLIQLVTPTTPRDRARRIAKTSTGFLYCVSVTGITGERDRLPDELLDQLRWLRGETDLPLCVGFGVSRPEHVRMLRDSVDGVIVGSALVRKLEQIGKRPAAEVVREMGQLCRTLSEALNGSA